MAVRDEIEVRERELSLLWHQVHVDRYQAQPMQDNWRGTNIAPHADEARALVDGLRRSGDLGAFQAATQRWSRSFDSGYKGLAGQMVINQINKMSEEPDVAVTVLLEALTTPRDLDDAVRKIRMLADYLEQIKVGAHPAPARAPFVASYFWALEDPTVWPAAWPRSFEYFDFCTGAVDADDHGERYAELCRFIQETAGGVLEFERVAAWWAQERPVILDEVLCDRATWGVGPEEGRADSQRYVGNARALVAVARHIGDTLEESVAGAARRTLKRHLPSLWWAEGYPRNDFWVDWRVPGNYRLGVTVWLNREGVAIGLRPMTERGANLDDILGVIEQHGLPGFEVFSGPNSPQTGKEVGLLGTPGEVIYARWFPRDSFASLDPVAEILSVAAAVAPLIAALKGESTENESDQGLVALVDEFKATTGFPTPKHEEDKAERSAWERLLRPDELAIVDLADLRRIWNGNGYGSTGPQSRLNTTFNGADDAEHKRILETLRYLCWGDDPVEKRIDRVLEDPDLRVNGLGESVAMKMLAITHPERFITVYPYGGPKGKLRMLKLLDLPTLEAPTATRGEKQVAANDALRNRLDRYFLGDPLGIGSFLYWFAERDEAAEELDTEVNPLDELADEVLVDREFLDEVVALLEDKKQVVLYGPPGTGKTYFARKLAEALVPDVQRRSIVQFHPSTSYEDFFEGYRPETDVDGVMSYRLQKGPLAELAARAQDAPGRRHIMIIDEINRANLPKVLGELLFLFEYRDTPIRTLYRPDDPFELAKDVWFIGTMNTADRSIALVDAALRRRFHFVPFFPNHGPMAGLLDRWLAREGEPAWVGELVAQVNDELERELGGPHLQLGASHFMRRGLDEESLRLIWRYDIEPFIEDQFFGDPARIQKFRFPAVLSRFRDLTEESISEGDVGSDGEG